MAERAGVFLTDPDKSHQTPERQAVEVRAGEGGEWDQFAAHLCWGIVISTRLEVGGRGRGGGQLDGAAPTLRYFVGWVVGGVAEEGWQGTLAHWIQRLCAVLATQEQFGGS